MQIIDTIRGWCAAHPYVVAYAALALLSVLAWAMQLPKAQAWLARYPIAKLVADVVARRLLAMAAAVGGDIPKLLAAAVHGQPPTAPTAKAEEKRSDDPPKPPSAPTVIVGAFLALLLLPGCPPSARAPQARQDARAVVTLVTYGVQRANVECAARGRALAATEPARALALLEKCQAATVDARAWLEAAEGAVDAWDAGATGRWACLVRSSLHGARSLAEALGALGAKLGALEDGIAGAEAIASFAAPSCSTTTTTTTPAADAGSGG